MSNYFTNKVHSSETLFSFEAWAFWQMFNDNTTMKDNFTRTKESIIADINAAIDWANTSSSVANLDNTNFVANLTKLHNDLVNISSTRVSDGITRTTETYTTVMRPFPKDPANVQAVIVQLQYNLNCYIDIAGSDEERRALSIFEKMLNNLNRDINPLRSIVCGVLDTSGSDYFWLAMLAESQDVKYLSHPPDEYAPLNIHSTTRKMCQKLITNCNNSSNCDAVNTIIKQVAIPKGTAGETVGVRLQVYAARGILDALRQIWEFSSSKPMDYNEGTYVVRIISRFFEEGFKHGRTNFDIRWAEEGSEASSRYDKIRKPDLRIKVPTSNLEVLFLESSRPQAGISKKILDWTKLVRMSKDAHNVMIKEITDNQWDRLHSFEKGGEFLERLSAMPIVMVQVHCLEMKIAVLDRPHMLYYRVRVLETFTIPLEPITSLETLEEFVKYWLRLQQYVDSLDNKLQNLKTECNRLIEGNFFQPYYGPAPISIDSFPTPSTM